MRARRLLGVGAGVLLLAACGSSGGSAETSSASTATATSTVSVPPSTTPASLTPAPPPVAPVSSQATGPCPYLGTDFVQETVGQHVSSSVVTMTTPAVGPLPQCDFLRSSGESVATVTTTTTASPAAAQAAAIGVAPQGNPITDIADGGVVLVGSGTTTAAVSKGAVVVVVVINQESSLEAHDIAAQVVTTF